MNPFDQYRKGRGPMHNAALIDDRMERLGMGELTGCAARIAHGIYGGVQSCIPMEMVGVPRRVRMNPPFRLPLPEDLPAEAPDGDAASEAVQA